MLFEVSNDGAKMLSRDTLEDSLHESPALKEKKNIDLKSSLTRSHEWVPMQLWFLLQHELIHEMLFQTLLFHHVLVLVNVFYFGLPFSGH